MDGRIEELDLTTIADAHIYLEFARQMKDQNTKKFLKQTKEISEKLDSYSAIHDQNIKSASSNVEGQAERCLTKNLKPMGQVPRLASLRKQASLTSTPKNKTSLELIRMAT